MILALIGFVLIKGGVWVEKLKTIQKQGAMDFHSFFNFAYFTE
jgi:hypothetical protein